MHLSWWIPLCSALLLGSAQVSVQQGDPVWFEDGEKVTDQCPGFCNNFNGLLDKIEKLSLDVKELRTSMKEMKDKQDMDRQTKVIPVPTDLTSAGLAKCQFLALEKSAQDLAYQGQSADNNNDLAKRFDECVQNSECVGIYLNPTTGRWRKFLLPQPVNRRFYEENCNSETVKVYLKKDRMDKYFTCDKTQFPVAGIPSMKNYYHYEQTNGNRANAKNLCTKIGGKLLEVESQEELQKVRGFVTTNDLAWAGLILKPGTPNARTNWVWEYSNTPLADWMWMGGEPSGDGSVGHVWMNGQVNDVTQEYQMHTVCECQDVMVTYAT